MKFILTCLLLLLWQACEGNAGDIASGETVLLVFSSDLKARLENCGCRKSSLGGWPGRAAVLDSLKQTHERVLQLDLGNLLSPQTDSTERQDAQFLRRAFLRSGMKKQLLGPNEWALDSRTRAAFIAAPGPAVLGTMAPGDGKFKRNSASALQMIDCSPDGQAVWTSVHAGAKPEDVLRIAVVYSTLEAALEFSYPSGTDLVLVSSDGRLLNRELLTDDGVRLLSCADRGRYLLRVRITNKNGWQILASGNLAIKSEEIRGAEWDSLDAHRSWQAQRRSTAILRAMNTARQAKGSAEIRSEDPVYVGDTECRQCHTKQYAGWKHGPHARTYADLLRQPGRPSGAQLERAVTGYLQPGGFLDYARTTQMVNVQCEACHGSAELHLQDPEAVQEWPMASRVCGECHLEEGILSRQWRAFQHGKP